jgi:hypothetical protein
VPPPVRAAFVHGKPRRSGALASEWNFPLRTAADEAVTRLKRLSE